MSNRLNWQTITESANIKKYNIYRSIIGAESANDGPFNLTDGMTLEVEIDGTRQIFTFNSEDFEDINSATPQEVVRVINNNGVGLISHIGSSNSFYIRSINPNGSVRIIAGDSNNVFGFPTVLYSAKSHFIKIDEVDYEPLIKVYEYIDEDGYVYDWYKISATDNLDVESALTIEKQAEGTRGSICIVFGKIQDARGYAIHDQEVKATIEYPPSVQCETHTSVTREEIKTLSLRDGYFELELLQTASYRVEIEAIEFSRVIKVPAEPSANLFTMDFEEKDGDSGGDEFCFS